MKLDTTAKGPFISNHQTISRRKFLRGAGIVLSLPLLDAMTPVFGAVAKRLAADATPGGKPRRFFGICNNLGLLPDQFFPKDSGRDYTLSPYLELLKDHRNDFTVCSGVWHPDVDGGHPADNCFLTAAPHPGSAGFRNSISLNNNSPNRFGNPPPFRRSPSASTSNRVCGACRGPVPVCSFRVRKRQQRFSPACFCRAPKKK